MTGSEPGWYEQPDGQMLYWNGTAWIVPVEPPPPADTSAPRVSALAIMAIVSVFLIPWLGLILGYAARGQIKRPGSHQSGMSLALAAIVLGWIFTAALVLFVGWVITTDS